MISASMQEASNLYGHVRIGLRGIVLGRNQIETFIMNVHIVEILGKNPFNKLGVCLKL